MVGSCAYAMRSSSECDNSLDCRLRKRDKNGDIRIFRTKQIDECVVAIISISLRGQLCQPDGRTAYVHRK